MKWTKVPYQPNGQYAESDNPDTWSSFEAVVRAYEKGGFSGIGFVLTKHIEIVGTDLDHCRNPETGVIEARAQRIVGRLASYTEITPSNEGLRIFIRAKLPPKDRKIGNFECYDSGRYLTVTGNHLEGTPTTIEHRQAEMDAVHTEVFAERNKTRTHGKASSPSALPNLDDQELLNKAFSAKNGEAVYRLYHGDISKYNSHSEADLALCSHLAYYTGPDPQKLDRLFRASDLYRPKWDDQRGSSTYGQMTINKVLETRTEFYSTNGRTAREANSHDAPVGDVLRNLTESAVRQQAPTFPDMAWHQLLAKVRNWIAPCTESPFEWVFSAAKTAVELVVGRRVYVQMGRRLYVNSAQVNIGPAAEKKGTPWALLAEEVLLPYGNSVGLNENNFQIARGTGSAEGLLQMFMAEREEEGAKGAKVVTLVSVPGKRVLTIEEELGYLLVKAHNKATSNLRENICQLWEGVDVSPPTRQRSLRVVQPFYSILTMTTPETLSSRLEEDDILSGMLTRFVFYQGTLREPIAWPAAPDTQAARLLAEELSNLTAHVQAVSSHGGLIEPSPAARAAWEEAYLILKEQSRKAGTPALGRMLMRIDTHTIKASLLYAMLSGHSRIEEDDLGRALSLGSYWGKTAEQIAGADLGDEAKRAEYKILAVVEQRPGVWVPVRELHQKVSGRVKAPEFHAAIRALVKLGRLETSPTDEMERPKMVRATGSDFC
jgi:hypothetical protein